MRFLVTFAFVFMSVVSTWTAAARAGPWKEDKTARALAIAHHYLHPSGSARVRPDAISIAVGENGRLAFSAGIGPSGYGRRTSAKTLFRVGSVTKQFTAAAILQMIERGALSPLTGKPISLATEIGEILPGVEAWHADGQNPITLRRLLNMTSNLPNFTHRPPASIDPWSPVTARRLLQALKRMRPSGWPGTYEYSNTSYFILAAVLEAAVWPDGKTRLYRDILRQNIFAPASMTGTAFMGEDHEELALPVFRRRPAFANRDWLKGSGDVASSALDVFAWNKAVMDNQILSPAMRSEMFSEAARVSPTIYYGMGWFIEASDGWQRYYHSGQVPGYTAFNLIAHRLGDPQNWISVTLLTNAGGAEGLETLAKDYLSLAANE